MVIGIRAINLSYTVCHEHPDSRERLENLVCEMARLDAKKLNAGADVKAQIQYLLDHGMTEEAILSSL